MNLANLLVRAGRCFGKHSAVAAGPRVVVDYETLAARVAALAGALRSRYGLQPGDRVALAMKNCPAYLEVLFGAWHAGLVAVPVNAKLSAPEVQYILDNSGARMCFVTSHLAEAVRPLVQGVATLEQVIAVEDAAYGELFGGEPVGVRERAPADPAWLFYTSGTTGKPKGATLTHRNLAAMISGYFSDVDPLQPGEGILHAAPMSHGSGLYALPYVAVGGLHIIPDSGGFDPDEIFDLLAVHERVSFFAAPTMVRRLTAAALRSKPDVHNLKTVTYGGGPMYVEDLREAMEVFGNRFVQIYGQGESPMTITAMSKLAHAQSDSPDYQHRLASVGRPQTLVEVSVMDADNAPLPPGEVGEVCVRGDIVMPGYWNNPEASAEALADGWLHTGDMGCFDEQGFLYLKDRSKDVIISGGTNVYPREVEEVLLAHHAVAEVAVLGDADPEWGEVVVAFVVPAGDTPVAATDLDDHCVQHIARFKRPRRYYFVDDLPKNAYGKVLKRSLRERLQAESAVLV
ncbi:Long-chain-fatty-acid--CoA ligase [wastewater metagenome]|uniref:Long-chain-fatty-acid--CoA ligase n=2 Tax=unclassified sequences TaxID=12908 RepID=A0A5B8RIU6_9ZZZZ|nr:AMP-binding protein [Arhodomonas sp. KWT]QEA06707.1 long-chain-fatty-acid--CoA ligase [uncultured organism]